MTLPAGCQYAGFWRRVLASVIDNIIFAVALLLVLGPGFVSAEFLSGSDLLKKAMILLLTVFFWVRFLGTPGKLLLGCQVVDATTLNPITPKQALIRYAGYFLSTLILFIGFFMVAWDKRKQGLHDKLAKTVVVYNSNFGYEDESQKSLRQLMSEAR